MLTNCSFLALHCKEHPLGWTRKCRFQSQTLPFNWKWYIALICSSWSLLCSRHNWAFFRWVLDTGEVVRLYYDFVFGLAKNEHDLSSWNKDIHVLCDLFRPTPPQIEKSFSIVLSNKSLWLPFTNLITCFLLNLIAVTWKTK